MIIKTELRARLAFRQEALKEAREGYLELMKGGVKSYTIAGRSLTKLDLPQLEASIRELEKEIDSLESQLAGNRRRRSVGVIPRDNW